jgi:hypothetical protein
MTLTAHAAVASAVRTRPATIAAVRNPVTVYVASTGCAQRVGNFVPATVCSARQRLGAVDCYT